MSVPPILDSCQLTQSMQARLTLISEICARAISSQTSILFSASPKPITQSLSTKMHLSTPPSSNTRIPSPSTSIRHAFQNVEHTINTRLMIVQAQNFRNRYVSAFFGMKMSSGGIQVVLWRLRDHQVAMDLAHSIRSLKYMLRRVKLEKQAATRYI